MKRKVTTKRIHHKSRRFKNIKITINTMNKLSTSNTIILSSNKMMGRQPSRTTQIKITKGSIIKSSSIRERSTSRERDNRNSIMMETSKITMLIKAKTTIITTTKEEITITMIRMSNSRIMIRIKTMRANTITKITITTGSSRQVMTSSSIRIDDIL